MRDKLPEFANKKELFKYLIENKSKLIDQRKSKIITLDSPFSSSSLIKMAEPKSAGSNLSSSDSLRVKIVGNTSNWVDSHYDVILPNSVKRSLNNRKHLIPHLKDHDYKIDSEIGDVVDIYTENVSLRDLGLDIDGSTESLIMLSDVKKEYDERAFKKYKAGKANQHSIGLQFVKLELAINDPDEEKEYAAWQKYYDQIINKEVVDDSSFFWAVLEYKLIEISLVLFGANELTPTLDSAKATPKNDTFNDTRKLEALNELLNVLN